MGKVLISGGTGLIGQALTKVLLERGHSVAHLSRKAPSSSNKVATFKWSLNDGYVDPQALIGTEVIVHLAGAPIVPKPWTKERVKVLTSSRCDSAELLLKECKRLEINLNAFISASGSHYHGALSSEQIFKESDPPGDDTIAGICVKWEKSADAFSELCRVVKMRTPIVLSANGGALGKLALPVKFGLGSALGSGKQWMPWVHIHDLVTAYVLAIEQQSLEGVFHCSAPEHVTNEEFTKVLARVLKRPLWLPRVPAFALRLILGEQSAVLLEGSRTDGSRISSSGLQWKFPKLEEALSDLLP